jgi:FkbM family methyltransferase
VLGGTRVGCLVREEFDPVCTLVVPGGRTLRFSAPNLLARHRAATLFEKEPETIAWIDGFRQGEVLFDVGANVGTYTIYAAAKGHRVIAIEPESGNYALLNRNIALNGLDASATAYCMGLGDRTGLFELNLSTTECANSQHQLGEALNFEGEPFQPAFRQGAVGTTLDALVEACNVKPNHIKIDVDGLEAAVVRGGQSVLGSGNVRSILVELNDSRADHRSIMDWLRGAGFRQVNRAQSEMTARGRFVDCFNYVWTRRE